MKANRRLKAAATALLERYTDDKLFQTSQEDVDAMQSQLDAMQVKLEEVTRLSNILDNWETKKLVEEKRQVLENAIKFFSVPTLGITTNMNMLEVVSSNNHTLSGVC